MVALVYAMYKIMEKFIEDIIHLLGAGAEYRWVNGAILHDSERA